MDDTRGTGPHDAAPSDGAPQGNGQGESAADRALAALVRERASRPAAPPALRARVEAALAAEVAAARAAGRRAPAGGPWAPALAAGLAGLAVLGSTAAMWAGLAATQRRLAADAVHAAFVEYARLEETGPTTPAADAAALGARLSAALGVQVRLAPPAGGRVRVTGTAPSTLFGARGVAVFFEVDGEQAMLTLVPSPRTFPAENRVRLGRGRPTVAAFGPIRFVLWRQGSLVCALAGDLPEPRLTALFRAIRPGLQVGG